MHKTFVVTDGVVMNPMREILFRGKRLDDGEWVYGSFVEQYGAKEIYLPDGVDSEHGFDHYHVLPESVGQYTGLKDKNGTKIFEGDILKVKTMWHAEFPNIKNCFEPPTKKETYWSVEYKDFRGEMGLMVYGIDRRFHKLLTWNRLYNTEAEVIGNIYDNPELMKGGVKQ